tara:strand:- start:38 stop:1174 length:1137 start_codon:yes stop_codon:yes gene_type:complete
MEDYLKNLPEGVREDLEIGGQTEAKGINAALTLGPLAAKPVLLKTLLGGTASLIKNNPLKTLDVVMTGVGASDIIDNPQDIAFETMSQKFDAMGGLKTKGYIKTGQFVYDQLSSMFKGNTLKQLAPVVPSVNKSNLNVLKTVEPVIQPSGGSTILQSVDKLDGVFTGNTDKIIKKAIESGAASKIVTEPVGITKAFPNNPKLAQDAETFVRKAYTHYNTKGQTLKGYGRFVDPNGDLWYMKKQQGAGQSARFSLRKLSRKKAWELTRYGRKAPDIEAIRQALKKHNAEHLVEDLLILRRKELKLKEAAIKKTGKSIGHLKSLAQKGIDVAENIADEAGKLNYARKHLSDLSDIELRKLNVPITWEDYVNLKLPSLLNK